MEYISLELLFEDFFQYLIKKRQKTKNKVYDSNKKNQYKKIINNAMKKISNQKNKTYDLLNINFGKKETFLQPWQEFCFNRIIKQKNKYKQSYLDIISKINELSN